MLKKDLLEKIKNVKDDEDINSLLLDTDIEEAFKSSGLTLEAFKGKLKEKDFKAFLESEHDKYFNKALGTWKENNLEKELDPFIKEKYPELVTDPTQKKLLELEKELEKERKANARKDLLAEAMKYAADKKLPASVVEKCLGEDLDSTKLLIDTIATDWTSGLETLTTEKMKSNSYVPGGSNPDGSKISVGASIAQQNNKTNTVTSDPWDSK